MTHDGQNPSAQTGSLAEEVARAQSSLAGILHQIQIHGLLPIASELMGVATTNRELSYQIGIKGRASVRFWPSNRCRREWPSRHSLVVLLVLALAACATDYSKSEAPNNLRVDGAESRVDVSFNPGSARLTRPDAIQQLVVA
jgi:hypothetical protein